MFLVIAAFFLAPSLVRAQNGEQTGVSPANPPSPLPDVLSTGTLDPKARLHMYDKDGPPLLVPDQTAADYFLSRDRATNGTLGLPMLDRVEIEADVRGDFAQVTGRFSALFAEDMVTTVNLGFGQVQISQQSFSGDRRRNRLQTMRDDPGWRWIVQGEPNTTQTATLTGVTRIAEDKERRSLQFSLPTAPCTLRLKLPAQADDLRVRSEDVLQRKESTQTNVEVEVNCRGGEFFLSWRERADVPQVDAIVASSETRFEVIDPTQPWLARTTLKIRWHGRDANSQIRIELPPGGQWAPIPKSDNERYLILPLEEALSQAVETSVVNTEPKTATESREDVSEKTLPAMPLMLENIDITHYDVLEIPLEWEWSPTLPTADSATADIKIKTPTLLGVDLHTGFIDCVVSSAYSVVHKEGDDGTQLSHRALDSIGQHLLRFRFERQPYDSTVAFRREQSLPTIRPTYLVKVDRHKLTLTMWFDCSFDINQPQMEFGLMLDDWVLQENTARLVTDGSEPFSSSGEVLRVQQQDDRDYVIRSTNGPPNNFGGVRHVDQTWRVVAERAWSAEDRELFFQVPRIVRGRDNGEPVIDHGSGALLVMSDNNVLLSWQETASTGLQRDSFSSEYERFAPNAGIRKPMVYRFQSSETTPRWAGRAEPLPQQVIAGQQLDLQVGTTQVAIHQKFEIQVANEALNALRFAVRQDAFKSQPPQVLINGQLVSARPLSMHEPNELKSMLAGTPTPPSPADSKVETSQSEASPTNHWWQSYQVDVPEVLGATRVEILSSVNWKSNEPPRPTDTVSPLGKSATPNEPTKNEPTKNEPNSSAPPDSTEGEYTRFDIPLAQLLLPSGVQYARQSWKLTTDASVDVVEDSGNWPIAQSLATNWLRGGQRTGILEGSQTVLQLKLRSREKLGTAPVRIEMSWLQSFVSDQKRRERFIARVTSSTDELQLKLPPAVNIREVNISVNGFKREPSYDRRTDIVTIPLGGSQGTSQVVEVSYFLPDALSWISVLSISPPEILGAEPAEQFYWQLLTPSVQHLGWCPPALTAEWTWKWSGLYWQRASQLNQQQLEDLIGAKSQEPPPASANSYVMSGRRVSGTTEAWVLSRFILWFPVGLLAIVISFTALNYAVVRKPVVVLALAVSVAAMATIWPDLAALAGQTALLSLGLVALVWVSQAAVDSRVRRRSVFSARPSTYIDRSDHYSQPRGGRHTAAIPPAPTHGSSTAVSGK